MINDTACVTFPPCWLGKIKQDSRYHLQPVKKVPGKHPGDRRSVVTLSPPVDKDLFHIHSNPETMTYQSLKSLQIWHPWASDNGYSAYMQLFFFFSPSIQLQKCNSQLSPFATLPNAGCISSVSQCRGVSGLTVLIKENDNKVIETSANIYLLTITRQQL